MKATLAELRRLVRVAEETGDRIDRLLAECIGEWLVLKEWITKEQQREAKTMAQVMTEWERSLEEFGSRREREGRTELLLSMARRKFGAAAGRRLADLLGTPPNSASARHGGGGGNRLRHGAGAAPTHGGWLPGRRVRGWPGI